MLSEQATRDQFRAAAEHVTPDVEAMARRVTSTARQQRTRRTAVLATAAAVAAVAGVLGAPGSLGWLTGPDHVQPAERPPNLDGGWVRVDDDGLQESTGLTAVTELDGRLIAVGGYSESPILTSTNGLTWTPADTPVVSQWRGWTTPNSPDGLGLDPRAWLYGIVRGGPGVIAFGDPGIWVSPDGLTWTEPADLPSIAAITPGGPGFVAVESGPGAAMWTSPDGLSWTFTDESLGPTTVVSDITATPDGLVAVGMVGHEFDNSRHPAIWTSPDGTSWSRVPHDPAVFPAGEVFEMRSVVVGGPGLLTVADQHVWTSTDGQTWANVTENLTGLGQDWVFRAVNIGGDVIAVGQGNGAAMWTTADGLTWERVTDDSFAGGPDGPKITDVIETSTGLVAVGTTDGDWGTVTGRPSAGAVWLRQQP